MFAFLGPLASVLIINFGSRVVMMLGSGLMATGTFASGFVPDIYFLYVTMGVITGKHSVNIVLLKCIRVHHYVAVQKHKI